MIARHLDGESNRKIAREEEIDRETVDRILTQKELVVMIAEQQTRLLRLGSKAIDVYEEALGGQDLGMALATATKILEGTGVQDKRGLQGTIDDALHRNHVKNTAYPPEFEQGYFGFVRPRDRPAPRKRAPKKLPTAELPKVREGAADNTDASPPPADPGILSTTTARVAGDVLVEALQGEAVPLDLKSDGASLPADQGILGATPVGVADDHGMPVRKPSLLALLPGLIPFLGMCFSVALWTALIRVVGVTFLIP